MSKRNFSGRTNLKNDFFRKKNHFKIKLKKNQKELQEKLLQKPRPYIENFIKDAVNLFYFKWKEMIIIENGILKSINKIMISDFLKTWSTEIGNFEDESDFQTCFKIFLNLESDINYKNYFLIWFNEDRNQIPPVYFKPNKIMKKGFVSAIERIGFLLILFAFCFSFS